MYGRQYKLHKISFCVLAVIILCAVNLSFAEDAQIPQIAPLNPEFVNYMISIKPLGVGALTADGHGLGYIPSPVDRSHLTGQSVFGIRPLEVLPASYDLRILGLVTPVKDQRNCGDCWAFASMASAESDLLSLAGESWDFSEYNLNMNHGFDWGACTGGNGDMSTAYFARWGDATHASGPLNESDDPYPAGFPAPPYTPPSAPLQKHVQEVLFIPARAGALDNDNLKQAVMTYGGVYTTYYASSTYYNKPCPAGTCTTYYYSGPHSADHAVMIVGWDDNFPSSSFTPVPPGNGAFIIKNSWGTGWGVNGGYFYISYYDSKMGGRGDASNISYVFNGAQPATNYIRAYQYDPLGHTSDLGYGSTVAWFANIFTAVASEELTAVGFYTDDVAVSYEVYIYTNVTSGPTTGSLGGSTAGSIATPGYHTTTLSSPVFITNGQKFSVVVKLTNSSDTYPIAAERHLAGFTSNATASPGQSYISSNGTSWQDMTEVASNANVCLKAFTGDSTPPGAPTGLFATPAFWTNGSSFSIDWANPSDPSGIAGAYYKLGSAPVSNEDGTYITSKPFTAVATAQGGQSIYVWLKDGAGNTLYTNNASTRLYYDITVPTDGTLLATPAPSQVSLSWYGFSDSGGSGLKSTNTYRVMRNAVTYPAAQCTDGTEVYIGPGTSTTDTRPGGTYYYRVCAYDNAGNVSTGSTAIATVPVQISIDTSPPGLEFSVDASPFTTPQTYLWNPGEAHTIATVSPQGGGAGMQYAFSSWSDAGALSHGITPNSDQTITATFTTRYLLTVSPPSGGSVTPDCSSGCWYNSGMSAQLLAIPDSGYIFGSWGGDCSGSNLAAAPSVTAQKDCTATFIPCESRPAKNMSTSTPFASLQSAYDDITTQSGDTISLLSTTTGGPVVLSRNIAVTISGGYDCAFYSNASSSIIAGSFTIGGESMEVTLDNIVIL